MSSPTWPPRCCVAAFLARAWASMAGDPDALRDEKARRRIAASIGIRVGSTDANPWSLPVDDDAEHWGVSSETAKDRLHVIESTLGVQHYLTLDIVNLNTVPFELYEDEVIKFSRNGAVIGISFDHRRLVQLQASTATSRLTRHVARLTPYDDEQNRVPNICSPEFAFD